MVNFGLAFQASQPLSHYVECTKLAKKYGFDMIQVYDDLMFKPVWPVLLAIAPYSSNILIGPGVVNPFHSHPAVVATNLACLQEETNDGAFLMIGRGAFHDLFNIKPERPIQAVKEAVEIIYNIVSQNTNDYHGVVFSAKSEARLRWKSTSKIPPIWIGTWGPKMCEIAGGMKEISGVMVSSITDARYIELLKEKIANGARSAGREMIGIGCVIGTIVSDDRDKANALAREACAVYLPYLEPMTEFVGVKRSEIESVKEALSESDLKLAASSVSDKSVDAFKLWGTPDDIIEKVERLIDKGDGVDRINFGFGRGAEDIEGIELLGSKVLPYFSSLIKSKEI
jgi:5,10-methylenetetrahydromethanopterin reductase